MVHGQVLGQEGDRQDGDRDRGSGDDGNDPRYLVLAQDPEHQDQRDAPNDARGEGCDPYASRVALQRDEEQRNQRWRKLQDPYDYGEDGAAGHVPDKDDPLQDAHEPERGCTS